MAIGSRRVTNAKHAHGSPRWWRYLSYVLLVLSIIVTAVFFLSYWLINAESGGRHNMGLALTMSFANVLAIYVSLIMVAIDFLVALTVTLARRRSRALWVATVVSLMPAGWLTALNYM